MANVLFPNTDYFTQPKIIQNYFNNWAHLAIVFGVWGGVGLLWWLVWEGDDGDPGVSVGWVEQPACQPE